MRPGLTEKVDRDSWKIAVTFSQKTVLRQVSLGLPCFVFSLPWEVFLRANLGILLWDILHICSKHRIRCFLIVVWIDSQFVLACYSKFEMVVGQKIWQILRRHPLWNVSILRKSILTTWKHFDPSTVPILRYCCKDRVWFVCSKPITITLILD